MLSAKLVFSDGDEFDLLIEEMRQLKTANKVNITAIVTRISDEQGNVKQEIEPVKEREA